MRAALALALLAAACATPPPARPTLPPALDVETLLPAWTPPEIPESLADGEPRAIGEGDCRDLPPGFWLSEHGFVEGIVTRAERDRLRAEVDAWQTLRREERFAAEAIIDQLGKKVEYSERRADIRLWVGVAAGAAAMLAASWAAGQVAR